MVWLLVNDNKFRFKFKTTSIEVRMNYVESLTSGYLHISDFKVMNDDGSLQTPIINENDRVSLIISNENISLHNFKIEYRHGWVVIIVYFENILEIHKRILDAVKNKMVQSLKCFNIFPGCNLRCPYCSQSLELHKAYSDDFDLYSSVIRKNIDIVNTAFDTHPIRYMDRVMGDETLLNWNIFSDRVTDVIKYNLHHVSGSFELYTNGTIPENVEKLFDWINRTGKKYYSRFEIIVTVDTSDYKTSRRYNTAETFRNYCRSLEILKRYMSDPSINIFFNIMYIDDDTFIETVKWLSGMGFKYYKPGFNERDDSEDYIQYYSNKSYELYNKCSELMTLVKTRNKYDLVYCFYIFEFDKMVYEHKFTFDVGYSCTQYFQSHKSRGDV